VGIRSAKVQTSPARNPCRPVIPAELRLAAVQFPRVSPEPHRTRNPTPQPCELPRPPSFQKCRPILKRCPVLCSRALLAITPAIVTCYKAAGGRLSGKQEGGAPWALAQCAPFPSWIGMNRGCADAWQACGRVFRSRLCKTLSRAAAGLFPNTTRRSPRQYLIIPQKGQVGPGADHSILRGFLHMVDYENLDWTFGRFEFEP
jgi:hypothetical protein